MRKLSGSVCIPFCLVALLGGCAEDAFLSYENEDPKLVVQAQLSPDASFKISITANQLPTHPGEFSVPLEEYLNVSLISSTGSVINLYRENDLYVDPLAYPVPGESYTLIINAPGFKAIEAKTSIPQVVELASASVLNLHMEESETTPDKMNLVYDIQLNFAPHEHRYFHFSFIQTTTINVGTVDSPNLQEQAYYINPEFPAEDGFYQHHETGVLIDEEMTGTSETLNFSFVDYTLGDIEELGEMYIEVKSVTPEYYHYYTSLARQLISREDPFAEPIPVYNNIRDGLGNFSGFSRVAYPIQILP